MKHFIRKAISVFFFSFATLSIFAQAPQKMSYQAVIRNSSNKLVTNTAIGIKISILKGSATGTAVFEERHVSTSNGNGLVSLEIGTGTIIFGNFANIDWSDGPYFVKTETDPAGGTNYSIIGTSQLLSVPYSLYSESANNAKTAENVLNNDDADADSTNELQVLSIKNDTLFLTNGGFVKLPQGFDGKYSSLSGVPTNVSSFTNDAGYITNPNDADADSANEIQTITKVGNMITLSSGGGSVADADNQSLTSTFSNINTRSLSITGGFGTSVDVRDADADTLNELQTISVSNDTVFISKNGSFAKLPPIWSPIGNSGLSDATNFIGTTDNIPFNIRVNNQKSGKIDHLLFNNFYGYQSGVSNTTGTGNLAMGYQALYTNTTSSNLLAHGFQALYSNTTGTENSAIGYKSMYANKTGRYNVAIGYYTLYANIGGESNVAVGHDALRAGNGGSNNVAVGQGSLAGNFGSNNVAMGSKSLYWNQNGDGNVAIGIQALQNNNYSDYNVAVGFLSLYKNSAGDENTGVGKYSLFELTSGGQNVGLGVNSGYNITTGSKNIMIGCNIHAPSPTASNQLSIGNIIYATGMDGDATTVSTGNVGIKVNAPKSSLDVYGSYGSAITTTTANLTLDGSHHTVIVNGGTPTITFPAASGVARRIYVIVNRTASPVTVSSYNAITGSTSTTVAANSKITVQSDGTNWYQID